MLILENKSLIIIKYITKKPLKHSTCATPADSVCRPFENFCFVQKRWLIVVFFYGKKSMSPLTADDVFKNSTPKSFCQKKMFTVFLSKKVFSMNLFFVCTPQMTFVWRSLVKTSTILVRWGPPNVWALTLENSGTYTMGSNIFWLLQILRDIFDQRNKTVCFILKKSVSF